MRPIDVCFRMIKMGILAVIALVIIGLCGPTVSAVGSYLVRPHQIVCDDYSLRVPLQWKVSLKRCDATVLLERRTGLLFDSESDNYSIYISSLRKAGRTADQTMTEFSKANPGKDISPVQVGGVFSRCLRVAVEADGSWISVQCVDQSNRVEFEFFGTEKGLNEAVSLIRLRP